MHALTLALNSAQRSRARAALLRWFELHRRQLPWRAGHDPYRVWVSEIMLQQTRVAAVLEHYARFLRRFPNVQALAQARSASVLAAWSGLGYYRRARMLHQAARQIVRERGGRFPVTAAEWRELAGIGRYTAAAIASIAFGEPCAVVDGNVQRVLQRLCGLRSGDCWAAAESLLSRRRPGDFNQAMMELGATVCLPGKPKCELCPLRKWCRTSFRVSPVTLRARSARTTRHVSFALVLDRRKVLLVRRGNHESLMAGMWELPGVPRDAHGARELFIVRHAITTTDYLVSVVSAAARDGADSVSGARWFAAGRAAKLPLTGLARKILRRAKIIEKQ